jgi:HEAT repeat protein
MTAKITVIVPWFLVVSLITMGLPSCTQSSYLAFFPPTSTGYESQLKIPKETIPSTIPNSVKTKIERLYSPEPLTRAVAAYELGEMGQDAVPAIPFLIGTFGDYMGNLEWRPENRLHVHGQNTSAAGEAEDALVKIGKPSVQPLCDALKSENADVRRDAAETLGKIGDARAVEPLILAVKNQDRNGGRVAGAGAAAAALSEIKDARAVEPFIAALKDEDKVVREVAAVALGKIGDARAVEPFIAALKDEDKAVREVAAVALGKMGDTRAVEPLIRALGDGHVRVRWGAEGALRELTGQSFGENPVKWKEWWEKNKKE